MGLPSSAAAPPLFQFLTLPHKATSARMGKSLCPKQTLRMDELDGLVAEGVVDQELSHRRLPVGGI